MIPRPEYPRPQFVREQWINLNGEWEFDVRPPLSEEIITPDKEPVLSQRILVPFCPESELSGINQKEFMTCVWYRRAFDLPATGKVRTLLHFGAVDYRATVWINGRRAGSHEGGYASFTLDITEWAVTGKNVIMLCAEDDTRDPLQPTGKQSTHPESYECFYTRTTGVWQTVWIEQVPENYIEKIRITPDAANGRISLEAYIHGNGMLRAEASYGGTVCAADEAVCDGQPVRMTLTLSERHLWNIGDPCLYDLRLSLRNGETEDRVQSYFGLRDATFDGDVFQLNGKAVFQRLVLDQGFWPDGIYTAPDDAAIRRDIEMAMAAGFNGARLHQKAFEQRYLYWADHLGFICWEEMGSWGLDHTRGDAVIPFLKEWLQVLDRDYNSPAIVCLCPFNETWDVEGRQQEDEVLRTVYRATKAADPTRYVVDTSGNFHVETDIYDIHDYVQDPIEFEGRYGKQRTVLFERHKRQHREGQPVSISEYGGIKWDVSRVEDSWGYGNAPRTEEEYLSRLEALTRILLDNPMFFGFCYTQLYDVEQECNGLYTYDRKPKFDIKKIAAIFSAPATIEKKD